jgi:cytochrome P450
VLSGVFNAEGDAWKVHRRLVAPAFNVANTEGYFRPVSDVIDVLTAKLSEVDADCSVNFSRLLACFSADVISKVAFGHEFGSLTRPESEEVSIVKRFFEATYSRMMAPLEWWKLPLIGRLDESRAASDQLSDLMGRFTAQFMRSNPTGDTLLSKLLQSEGREKLANGRRKSLTTEEMVGNLKTIFLAGTDTTSQTLAWAFYHLAQQPRLQDMLAAELASEAPDGITSVQHLERLHLVRAVWAETLRLRSVAPVIFLHNSEELCLAGRPVLPGTEIVVLTRYVENTTAEIQALGPDIQDYRPERWLVDGAFKPASRDPLAFGQGARACLGKRLADLEGQLTIAEVVRNFRLSGGPAALGEVTKFTQGPDRDIELRVARRVQVPSASQ